MKRIFYLSMLMVFCLNAVEAQFFTDQGVLSGSGLTVLPTSTIAPASEFRLQYARLEYLKNGYRGINIFTLSSGFSTNLEGYVRLTGEQLGTVNSQVVYGFGGKFQMPIVVPVVRRLAFWLESTRSDGMQPSALFPSDAFRAAAVATFDSNGIRPTLLLGLSSFQNSTSSLLGAGMTIAASHDVQLGIEAMRGYLERNSVQVIGSLAVRVLPGMSLQASPGYLSTATASMWTLSLGISLSTTDVDFHPIQEVEVKDEFIMPTLEEIEKQLQQEPQKKDSLRDGSLNMRLLPEGMKNEITGGPTQSVRPLRKESYDRNQSALCKSSYGENTPKERIDE